MPGMIGPYELRGELGRGAMAIVWRAWDPNLEREVAIKEPVIPNGTPPDLATELSLRFVREGKAVAKLNHPGIVTVYDSGIYDGRPAMVMELIEGATLAVLLATEGRLEPSSAIAVSVQLLDAISYAHERGIVHRDVKPDNVFVTAAGRIKLADFGIARLADQTRYTQEGTVMGTPGYMAPEQVLGLPADARADIFAAGAILYEMLTGSNPFGASEGIQSSSVMYRIVHEDPLRVDKVVEGLPGWLGQVLAVALAKDPEKRYPDAKSMRADLLGQSASMKAPAGGAGRRPTASIVAVVAAVLMLAVAGLWLSSRQAGTAAGVTGGAAGTSATATAAAGIVSSSATTKPNLPAGPGTICFIRAKRVCALDPIGMKTREISSELAGLDPNQQPDLIWSDSASCLYVLGLTTDGGSNVWKVLLDGSTTVFHSFKNEDNPARLIVTPDGHPASMVGNGATDLLTGKTAFKFPDNGSATWLGYVIWRPGDSDTSLISRRHDGGGEIGLSDGRGGSFLALSPSVDGGTEPGCFAWSPDGQRFVAEFSGLDASQPTHLVLFDWRGRETGAVAKQDGASGIIDSVSWSPDGKRAVYELDGKLLLLDVDVNRSTTTGVADALSPVWIAGR